VRLIIAGGGTGGHLFPGIAIAEEFLKRDPRNRVLFIGTKKGIEQRVLGRWGYDLKLIEVEGLKGRGMSALIKGVYAIPHSMWQSLNIMRDFHPDVVLGVGGYASGPVVITAWMMRIPTAIAEQNALAGNTNLILGRFVKKVFLTYEQSRKGFAPEKVILTGNPVRAAFAAGLFQTDSNKPGPQIFIFGGSQGASAINRTVVAMLPLLEKLTKGFRIVHQTGEQDYDMVREAYKKHGLVAQVSPFIVDMVSVYAASDVIICRAGATSLAEITAAGRAAILIPFPWAANDHQTHNAKAMVEAGAAFMIQESELTPEILFEKIRNLLEDERKLKEMERQSKKLGRLDAATRIVDACLQLAAEHR